MSETGGTSTFTESPKAHTHGQTYSHEHNCCGCHCEHCLHFCAHCNVVYCCKCRQEWYQWYHYSVPQTAGNWPYPQTAGNWPYPQTEVTISAFSSHTHYG